VILTVLVFGILSFSFHFIWSYFEHSMLLLAQTDDSIDSSTFSFSLSTLVEQGSPYLGNLSAPATIIDFSDFQCHLCARYVKNTEPLINDTYIQTGKVALVFKHLPNRGFDSRGCSLGLSMCTRTRKVLAILQATI
jgi:Thioredoxin